MTATPKQPLKRNDPAREALERGSESPQEDKQLLRDESEGRKATQFDGNPNVQKAPAGPLGPQDDTPWKLPKKG